MVNSDVRLKHFQSKLRKVKDGIKPKNQAGKFGNTWWSKKWIDSLEYLENDKRVSQGKFYAMIGQIRELQLSKGLIQAKVQGTKIKPYTVVINLRTITEEQWKTIFEHLSENSQVLSDLLMGTFPPKINDLFTTQNYPLFPSLINDLKASCSCADWANPCKHIAAVYYLISDIFEDDPFLIFQLRGKSKIEFIEILKQFIALKTINKKDLHDFHSYQALNSSNPYIAFNSETFWQRKTKIRIGSILDLLRCEEKQTVNENDFISSSINTNFSHLLKTSYKKTQSILKNNLQEIHKDEI